MKEKIRLTHMIRNVDTGLFFSGSYKKEEWIELNFGIGPERYAKQLYAWCKKKGYNVELLPYEP